MSLLPEQAPEIERQLAQHATGHHADMIAVDGWRGMFRPAANFLEKVRSPVKASQLRFVCVACEAAEQMKRALERGDA